MSNMKVNLNIIPEEARRYVYKFLDKHWELVNDNKFEDLYQEAVLDFTFGLNLGPRLRISYLTLVLLDADINPIPYFKNSLPAYFLYMAKGSGIKYIELTPNIEMLEESCFKSSGLSEIKLTGKTRGFDNGCFANNGETLIIYFDGTLRDFNNSYFEDYVFENTNVQLHCKDKSVNFSGDALQVIGD